MGIIKKTALLLCLVFCGVGITYGQDYPKKTVAGNEYYVYTVEPGNTAYAISRQFSVSVSDLSQANPGLADGLSIGEEVLIPIDAIDKKQARKEEVTAEGAYLLHTVQKKETLFSISKKYNVELNTLMDLNPEAAKSLSRGSVIRVPVEKIGGIDEKFVEPAKNDSLINHEVSEGETLYSISKKYNVSVDSILAVNPVDVNNLSIGQWVIIPKYNEAFESLTAEEATADSLAAIYSGEKKQKYKVGLMLPFELSLNDSIEKELAKGNDLYVLTEIALEYYRSTKLALDSLKKRGLDLDVYVYDVGEDLVNARVTIKKPEIKDLDLIIGPLHKASLAVVSDMAREQGIYLVSPNNFANEVFEDNPYLFRAQPSRETMLRYLATYVAVQHQHHNVLMISSEGPKEWPLRQQFINNYNDAVGTFPNDYSDSLRSINIDKINDEDMAKWLREDTTNILVVPSNDLAFVSDFMTRLSRIDEEKYDIQVYGLDKWIKYENIESTYKNRFRLRLVVPQYIDYSEPDIQNYLEHFYQEYEMEPSSYGYGFMGYDLMLFFGEALLERGTALANGIELKEMDGLGMNYRFAPSTTGKELENKSVFIVEYDDFSIKRIN